MRIEGQGGLSLLQDLALIYLGLARGADHDLDPSEAREIAARLRRWQPDKDPALIDHVIRDVSLSYDEETDDDEVAAAVEALGGKLSEDLRQSILEDLSGIARADGTVVPAEEDFIHRIADAWQLGFEGGIEQPST